MPSYKTLYHKTYNAITDAHRLLEQATSILETAQQECEDIYSRQGDIVELEGYIAPEPDKN